MTAAAATSGWQRELLPPNLTFLCVHRDATGRVFAGGYNGLWTRGADGRWSECTLRGRPGYATFVHDLTGDEDDVLFAITTNGSVSSSADGVRWTPRRTGIKHYGQRVVCLGAGRVVALGERHECAVSTDRGRTFTLGPRLDTSVQDAWYDAAAGVLYAVGYPALARSTDGGASWSEHQWRGGDGGGVLRGVYAADGVMLVVAGTAIHRSEDGGASWSQVYQGEDELACVRGRGLDAVYAAGSRGTLLRSDDAGRRWTRVELGLFAELHAVHCARDGAVYVAGDDSALLVAGERARGASAAHPPPPPPRAIAGWTPAPVPLPAGAPLERDPEPYVPPPDARHCALVPAVAWVDDRTLVSCDDAGRVLRWDERTGAGGTADAAGAWRCAATLAGTNPRRLDQLVVHGGRVFGLGDDALHALELSGAPCALASQPLGYWATRIALRGATLFALDGSSLAALRWQPATRSFAVDPAAPAVRDAVADIDAAGERVLVGRAGALEIRAVADGAVLATVRPARAARAFLGAEPETVVVQDYPARELSAVAGGSRRRRWRLVQAAPFTRFEPDAAHRFVACFDGEGAFALVDLARGHTALGLPPATLDADGRTRPDAVTAAAVSPDGTRVAVGRASGALAVHELAGGDAATPRVLSPTWLPPLRPARTRVLLRDGECALAAGDGARLVVVGARGVHAVDVDHGGLHALGGPLPLALRDARRARAVVAGEVLLVWDGARDWSAIDLAAGALLWTRALPIDSLVAWDAARAYTFERHGTYAMGQRVGHTLQRLEVRTGELAPVALPAPPGAADHRGYGAALARTAAGLLVGFDVDGERRLACLYAPDRGEVAVVASDPAEPVAIGDQMIRSPAAVSRSGRYVLWGGYDGDEIVVRDLGARGAPLVGRVTLGLPSRRGASMDALALAPEHDRVAGIDRASGVLHVWNTRGELLARYAAPSATPAARAVFADDGRSLTLWSHGGEVRRVALH